MKEALTRAFGKRSIGYHIHNQKSKMELAEDPMTYVMKVIRMLVVLSPNATENEKVYTLFDELPARLKIVL